GGRAPRHAGTARPYDPGRIGRARGRLDRASARDLRPELERVELRVAQPENEAHRLSGERAQVGAPAPRDGPGQVVAEERVAVGGGEARQRNAARVGELHAHVAGRGSLGVQLEAAAGELDERSGQAAAAVVGIGRNEAVEALDGPKDRAHAAQALEAGVLAVEVVVAGVVLVDFAAPADPADQDVHRAAVGRAIDPELDIR